MKQQYSLTSIWYLSLNSIAFVVATVGTIQAIVPSQPPQRIQTISQPVKEPFNLSFNLYKPKISALVEPNFQLKLLPVPNAESQKCQVFSCLPPNPFHNLNKQEYLNNQDLQKGNYRYISSDIKSYILKTDRNCHSKRKAELFPKGSEESLRCFTLLRSVQHDKSLVFTRGQYKLDRINNIEKLASLNTNSAFIPIIPTIQQVNPPTVKPKTAQTINSGIFQGTYELYSQSSPSVSLAHQNNVASNPIQEISITVGDAVYLALANGADKNAYLVNIKIPSALKPVYKWNNVSNINQSQQLDIKLSLTKEIDKKIARLNELINRQDSRNALNSKITNVVVTYNRLLQAQAKVKIAELSLNNAERLNSTAIGKYRIPLLVAENEVKARRLELASILEIDNKQITASEIPVIKLISLELENLRKIALAYQPNYLRNRFSFEISQLVDKDKQVKAETLKNATFQLDTQLQNSIYYINSIYSQIEGARQAVKISKQQLSVEQEKSKLGKGSESELIGRINELAVAQNKEVEVSLRYLNALANLDQLLGTTFKTWEASI